MNAFASVNDLLLAFDRLHVSQLKDPRPTRCKLRLYFDPLRPLPLDSLTVPIVLEWYNGIRKRSQVQADGCISLLRTAINCAIEWDMFRGTNVARLVKRRAFPRRERYVMEGERPPLITEIDREPLMLRVYFYMLYYVAPRPGEVRQIQIENIKLFKRDEKHTGVWIKPTTKTRKAHQIPLPSFVCELLATYIAGLPPEQTFLFIGSRGTPPSKEWWQEQWVEIRRRAGLWDVQQRDLRRSCATDLTEHLDLISISKAVLNHKDLNTTQIYVQPIDKRVINAMNLNVQMNRSHLQPQGGNHAQNTGLPKPLPLQQPSPSPDLDVF